MFLRNGGHFREVMADGTRRLARVVVIRRGDRGPGTEREIAVLGVAIAALAAIDVAVLSLLGALGAPVWAYGGNLLITGLFVAAVVGWRRSRARRAGWPVRLDPRPPFLVGRDSLLAELRGHLPLRSRMRTLRRDRRPDVPE